MKRERRSAVDIFKTKFLQYKRGKADISEVIVVIERYKTLKKAFANFIVKFLREQLEERSITDFLDAYSYFVPLKLRIEDVIEGFYRRVS